MTIAAKLNTAPTFTVRDGKLNTSFDAGSNDMPYHVNRQSDGKLLVSGLSDGKFAMARYNVDGSLDTSFSGDGLLKDTWGAYYNEIKTTIQSDGKILITATGGSGFTAVRYLSNGNRDTTFGNGGLLEVFSSSQYGDIIATLPDGGFLTAGSNASDYSDYAIKRYKADGTPDTSYSGDGRAEVDVSVIGRPGKVLVQADGKVLISASNNKLSVPTNTLLRLNANGTLDTSFSGDGTAPLAVSGELSVSTLTQQSDGKILLGGMLIQNGAWKMTMMRYKVDGSLDLGFNGTGTVTLPANRTTPFDIVSIAFQKDGKILAVGSGLGGNNTGHVVVVRLLQDGTLDKTFGDAGMAAAPIQLVSGANDVTPKELLVQPDGKIVVMGWGASNMSDFVLIRYNADGSLDNTFSPPADTLDAAPVYRETYAPYSPADNAVVLDGDVRIFDAELSAANNFNGASLTLQRHGGASADDMFMSVSGGTLSALTAGTYFSVGGVTIGRVTANEQGTLTLTFGANATQDLVNKAMRQIAYANQSDAPQENVQIDWIFNDGNISAQGTGGALKATGSVTVKIIGANDTPQAMLPLPDQKIATGVAFSYTIPSGTFVDPDHDVLGYSVLMDDGSALPPWLTFNASTRTLSGMPDASHRGTLAIRVEVRDASGDTASTGLNLTIEIPSNHVIGTSGADKLTGSAGNDVLLAYAGNDTLDGKAGADNMAGGDGNDVYYVDNVGDVVVEAGTAAGGVDTVYSTLGQYTLTQHVEYGRVLSNAAANLTGNDLANVLYAGNGNNVLDGGLGIDTASYAYATAGVTVSLSSPLAQDTEGSGIDTLRNIESLAGSRFDDVLVGNQENNTLNGGTGADLMAGGNGSDTYVVDDAEDIVRETNADAVKGGTDTITASITYKLGANLENLTLTGTAVINGSGNNLVNKLVGNSANNILDGGAGADTLSGGLGNDTLIGGLGKDLLEGGAGSDLFVFNVFAESGTTATTRDVIKDFVRGQDKIDLRMLDANTATTTNDAFTGFIAGTAAFTAAGQLKLAGGVLYGNTDADGDAEFTIELTGITQLSTVDIML